MANEANKTIVENITSTIGSISAVASAHAPITYFENVPYSATLNGVAKITLTANRLIAHGPDGRPLQDVVIVCQLVGNIPAMRALKVVVDSIILMAGPVPEGPAH